MSKALATAAAALAVALLGACTKAEEEYSEEPCYFVFDNSVHQNSTLSTAMISTSPGVFCLVKETKESGATYFEFKNNQGLSSKSIANAIDMQRTRRLGRRNGLIVGYSNADITAPQFMAYDAQCPICYSGTGLLDRTLSIDSRGIATCSTCHRTYDLNNNGYISTGGKPDDSTNKLLRYRASTTGAFGILVVSN